MRCFFVKCIICTKPIFDNITFNNLFTTKNYIHSQCDQLFQINVKTTFPITNKLVEYDYLFPMAHFNANYEQIFFYYMGKWLKHFLNEIDNRLLVFYDDVDEEDLSLVLQLANGVITLLVLVEKSYGKEN